MFGESAAPQAPLSRTQKIIRFAELSKQFAEEEAQRLELGDMSPAQSLPEIVLELDAAVARLRSYECFERDLQTSNMIYHLLAVEHK